MTDRIHFKVNKNSSKFFSSGNFFFCAQGVKVRVSNGSVTTFDSQVLVTSYNQSTGTGMVCGESTIYDLKPVYLFMKGPHTGDNLILEVMNANFNTLEMVYYGIREISLTFSTTTQSSTVYYGLSNPVSLLQDTHYTCAIGKYLSGSTCKACDDSCGACWGAGADQCYFCNSDYYYDATECVACDSSCKTCTGSLATQCSTCPSGSYLYNNNSCISSCKSPYTKRTANGIDYCDFPCDIGEYYYPINGTCVEYISFPFTARTDGLNLFADYPCNSSSYVYPDRTCKLYCNSPMIIDTPYQTKLCKKPCSNKTPYYLTAKEQCNATCDAPYLTSSTAYYTTCYRVLNNPLMFFVSQIVYMGSYFDIERPYRITPGICKNLSFTFFFSILLILKPFLEKKFKKNLEKKSKKFSRTLSSKLSFHLFS